MDASGDPAVPKGADALLRKALASLAVVDGVVFSGDQKALTFDLVRRVTAEANRRGSSSP